MNVCTMNCNTPSMFPVHKTFCAIIIITMTMSRNVLRTGIMCNPNPTNNPSTPSVVQIFLTHTGIKCWMSHCLVHLNLIRLLAQRCRHLTLSSFNISFLLRGCVCHMSLQLKKWRLLSISLLFSIPIASVFNIRSISHGRNTYR